MRIVGLLLALAFVSPAASPDAPLPVSELLERKLKDRIRAIDESLPGALGVFIIDLSTSRTLTWNETTVFPQASSIKIPIMVEVFRAAREGKFKLTDPAPLNQSDAVGGSGHLRLLLRTRPLPLTVGELITAMIETSDNTATNKLIALVGMENVNATMKRLGFPGTRLQRIMLDSAAASQDRENISTPTEMARLVELIYRGKAVDAEASKQMIETLKLVDADFRAAVPSNVPVASKPGGVPGVRCESGVILLPERPFVLSVMSTFLPDGANPVRDVARAAYEHFAKIRASNRYGNRVR